MRCVLANAEGIIKDDIGIGSELVDYVRLVLQSNTAVSVRSRGLDILLTPIETIAGRLVLGLLKDEPFNDAVRCFVDQLLLSERRWPTIVEELAKQIDAWRGKRYVGLLHAKDFTQRYVARERLSSVAIGTLNVGEHDLYVFSTILLPTLSNVKLCVSTACEDPKEAVRQALLLDRYVVGEGTFFYERMFEYELNVKVEDSDAEIIAQRLISYDLQNFAGRLNVSPSEAFRLQRELEDKYLLRFNVGLECHAYVQGLVSRRQGEKR
ncbi:DUF4940 domain-containing protein [Pseudothermotoga sp.]